MLCIIKSLVLERVISQQMSRPRILRSCLSYVYTVPGPPPLEKWKSKKVRSDLGSHANFPQLFVLVQFRDQQERHSQKGYALSVPCRNACLPLCKKDIGEVYVLLSASSIPSYWALPIQKIRRRRAYLCENMFQAVLHTEHRIGTAQRPHNPWRGTLHQTDPDANRNGIRLVLTYMQGQ